MKQDRRDDNPFTVEQIVAAMAALGMYRGEQTELEHAREAKRLGGMNTYQARLANALLGVVEVDAMLADGSGLSESHMQAAHQQALQSAGVAEQPGKLLSFLRWRTLRVGGPLRVIAQNKEAGPLPLAAAHAAEGLQMLLGVCAAGQDLSNLSPAELQADLVTARESLTDAIANLDIFLTLLDQINDLF